jgi:hypothetical protein
MHGRSTWDVNECDTFVKASSRVFMEVPTKHGGD